MLRRSSLLLAAGILFGTATWAAADTAVFTQRLKDEDREAAGIAKLSDDQLATLNNLVEREIRFAREGDVPAFAAEFSSRRSLPERAKAGLDRLTPEERTKLDALVARAIADRPINRATVLTPVVTSEAVRGVAPKPIVHGHVSFTVGTAGSGRNFYGGSVYVEQTDPQKGYTIGIGYSEYHGKGLWPYDYYGYGYYDYPYPYYPYGYYDIPLRIDARLQQGANPDPGMIRVEYPRFYGRRRF